AGVVASRRAVDDGAALAALDVHVRLGGRGSADIERDRVAPVRSSIAVGVRDHAQRQRPGPAGRASAAMAAPGATAAAAATLGGERGARDEAEREGSDEACLEQGLGDVPDATLALHVDG